MFCVDRCFSLYKLCGDYFLTCFILLLVSTWCCDSTAFQKWKRKLIICFLCICREGPLLVVASGRDTVSVAAAVKKLAPEATFVIQVRGRLYFELLPPLPVFSFLLQPG